MEITNLTGRTIFLPRSRGDGVRLPSGTTEFADAAYTADDLFNAAVDALVAQGQASLAGAPTDPFVAGAGALSVQSIALTLSTDPDTFEVAAWEYDFGRVTPLFISIKVTALDGDGETWGDDEGEIGFSAGFEGQRDDAPSVPGWTGLQPVFRVLNANVRDQFDTVGEYVALTTISPQCIRLGGRIYQDSAPYAGSNHPTATFDLYLEYLG